MFKSCLLSLILSTAACISGGGDADPAECARDEDCTKFSNACNTSVCRGESCVSQPVVCADDNVCTDDRCDAASGCVFTPVAGRPCAVGQSGACDELTWHPTDACDDAGACVDSASVDCDVGSDNACIRAACNARSGCTMANEANGTDCVAGGRSDTCIDGERFFADFCDGGTCAEAGKERCPDAFCQRGRCDGDGCGTVDVGLGINLTGAWNAFGLVEDGTLVTTRLGILLTDTGAVEIRGQVGTVDAPVASGGAYCITPDRAMQIGFDYDGQRRSFSGHVSPGRDIAFFVADEGAGVLVLVRDRELSEARLAGGTYRVLGFDSVVRSGVPGFDALQGTVEIKDLCIDGGAYRLGEAGEEVPINRSDPPSCLKFDGLNSVLLDVRAQGDVHALAGVVGTGGHYLVMQRYRVGERILEPSLLVFVRTALSTAEAFKGDYSFTRMDAGLQLSTSTGTMDLDGDGGITAFVDGPASLAPGTTGTLQSLGDAAYLAIVELTGATYERAGQLGQTTFDRADWFVDVGTAGGVINGRSLRFGVRSN